MANGLFPAFLAACVGGTQTLNLATGLTLVLVDSGYVYSAGHDFYNDVSAGAVVATYALEGVAVDSAGVITADDDPAAFPALAGDTVAEALLIRDTGTPATSRLVGRWTSASGLPLAPSGDDIGVAWPDSVVLRPGIVTS